MERGSKIAAALMAVAGMLLISRTAEAQSFDGSYRLDEKVAVGVTKEVWTLRDAKGQPVPDKVLVRVTSNDWKDKLREEVESTAPLARAGVPSVQSLEMGEIGGRAASLQPRFVGRTRAFVVPQSSPDGTVKFASRPEGAGRWELSEKTLESLVRIRTALERADLVVVNPELEVAADGSVFLGSQIGSTPLVVRKGASAERMNAYFTEVERDARQAILARKLEGMTDFPGGMSRERARALARDPAALEKAVLDTLAKSSDLDAPRVKEALERKTRSDTIAAGRAQLGGNASPVEIARDRAPRVSETAGIGGILEDRMRGERARLR